MLGMTSFFIFMTIMMCTSHGTLCFCIIFLSYCLSLSLVISSDPTSSNSHVMQQATNDPHTNNVMPNAVRSHHLHEAKRHIREGGKGAFNAIRKGAETSARSILISCISGRSICEGIPHSIKNAQSGCAACTNTSYFSLKNVFKHLTKSYSARKNNKSQQEFEQEKTNDQRHRESNYNRLRQETDSISPLHP